MPAIAMFLALALAIAVAAKRQQVGDMAIIPGTLDDGRGSGGGQGGGAGGGASGWSGAGLQWGAPRVPSALAAAADTAKRNGWFREQGASTSTAESALASCADGFEVLTGKRDPSLWVDVYQREGASPDSGSLWNAAAWSDVAKLRTAWVECASKNCTESVKRDRRARYLAALDPWRRAGLVLVVKRGLQSEPAP